MTTTISDYITVSERAASLGCAVPDTMAVLPVNFDSATTHRDFRQRSEAATVRTLFRTNGLPLSEFLPPDERGPYIHDNAFELVFPALFISATLITQNPIAVELALHVLGAYITDFFKGIAGKRNVKLDIVVEKKGNRSCKMISYEGDAPGLEALPEIIRRVCDE